MPLAADEHGTDGDETPTTPSRTAGVAAGLLVGAAVGVVGVVAMLGWTGTRPAVVGIGDSQPQPVEWLQFLAVPVAVFAVVLLVLIGRRFALSTRLFASLCTAVFLAVCGLLAWHGIPKPGVTFGLGARIPWTLAGCGLGVLACLVYAAGALLRKGTSAHLPAKWWTALTSLLAVVALAAGGLAGAHTADAWTGAQNTDTQHAPGPLRGQRASALSGTARWHAPASRYLVATRGGIVVVAGPGVYALDPTTGRQRWRYARWGTSFTAAPQSTPVASPDGRYVGISTGLGSGYDQLFNGRSTKGQVYLFDTSRGRLLDVVDVRNGQPRYVDRDTVVVDDGRDAPRGVVGYRRDGTKAWTDAGRHGCLLGAVVGVGADILVGQNCKGRARVVVRDATTGRERWHWSHTGYVSENGLVTAGGTVVADLPSTAKGHGRSQHTVTSLDASTGRVHWTRENVRVGDADPHDIDYSYIALRSGTTLVLGGTSRDGQPPAELVGLDTGGGSTRWHRTVPFDSLRYQRYLLPSSGDRGVADVVRVVGGRVVLAGTTYDARDHGTAKAPTIRTVDAATGRPGLSWLLPDGRTGRGTAQWLGAVGDTAVVAVEPEHSETYDVVGLG